MPLPGEAAARQLQGSTAARTRLQERLAANEEVRCLMPILVNMESWHERPA